MVSRLLRLKPLQDAFERGRIDIEGRQGVPDIETPAASSGKITSSAPGASGFVVLIDSPFSSAYSRLNGRMAFQSVWNIISLLMGLDTYPSIPAPQTLLLVAFHGVRRHGDNR